MASVFDWVFFFFFDKVSFPFLLHPRCFWPSFPWLVCAEFSAISVIVLSGSLSKLTSGPFFNTDAHLKITWHGSCTTRYVQEINERSKYKTASGSDPSATKASHTIEAKQLKYARSKVTSAMFGTGDSSQGEACIMGMKRSFQKLKANVRCVKARDQYNSQMSDSCPCTEADFEWWVPRSDIFTSLHPTFDQFQEAEGSKQEPIRFTLYNSLLFLLSPHWHTVWGINNRKFQIELELKKKCHS